jgi:UDP-4-amino-4,6-dideoxy-N-acetyl-beta-L-altrosamine N-acetyltransferase
MLRRLEESDLELILPWRNAPDVRQAMYTRHEISMEEHRAWFQRMQGEASAQWFLYFDKSGMPGGVVYFTDIDATQGNAFWGFYARPGAAPGTGMRMSLEAMDLAFGDLSLRKINGEVLASNQRSLNMHTKVGFTEEGRFREQYFNGEQRIDVVRLGMLASEWLDRREQLQARVAALDVRAGT